MPSDEIRPTIVSTVTNTGVRDISTPVRKHIRHASVASLEGMSIPNQPPQTMRKKTGQPIKSSLKGARRPELHVVTNGPFAKSEPATPTHTKAVHFDSKLEHVKLFLAEQKPLAVSRDGSPTSDTSGDEFPPFIYGDGRHENKHVKMLVPNMPLLPKKEENVALQGLVLSRDQRTITGNVRVRNIAYEKWLAVRFTLDWWQTTSEVTARYDKSIEDGAFDAFTFTIRLHDIWSRIEEKTIFIALRYTVAGHEYWDNNAGNNYHIKFVLAPPLEPSSAVDNETSLRDLNTRLEGLAKDRSASIPSTSYRPGRSFSADYRHSKPSSNFASAYKTQWVRNALPLASHRTRTYTFPSGVPTTAGPIVAPWSNVSKVDETKQVSSPQRPGSPREATSGTSTPPTRTEVKLALPASPSPSPSRSPDGRERNHRRSFIDGVMDGSPSLRRTPSGSPLKLDVTGNDVGTLSRTRPHLSIAEKPGSPQQSIMKPPLSIQTSPIGKGGSEESTPYETSQTSSSSNSSYTPLFSPRIDCSRSDTSYKELIEQFCFYTGADSLLQESSEALSRSHSTSSIEHYLLSHSPPPSFSSHMRDLPSRFPFDSSGSPPTALRV